MSIIYSYPIKGAAVDDDLILISDSASTPKFATKQVRVSGLPFSNNQGTVTSVGVSMPSAFAVASSPITDSGTIAVTTTGGNVGQFLAHDGTWGTPAGGAANPAGSNSEIQYNNSGAFGASPDFSYASNILRVKHTINVLGQGNGNPAGRIKLHCENSSHGVTLEGPAHAGNNSYNLKFPGSAPNNNQILEYTTSGNLGWINTPSGGGGGSYTAGDGLQLNGTSFSTDLKLNGGLVIETTSLALDLGASSITGTLAVSDGGTGSSSTEYCNLTTNVTGILPVVNGGTGLSTFGTTSGYVLTSDGSSSTSWAASTNISNADLSFSANRTLDIGNKSLTIIDTGSGSAKNLFKFVNVNATDTTFIVGHTESAKEGYIVIEGNGSNRTGQVQFKDAAGDNYTGIKAATTQTVNINYTLPATQGAANSFLKNNGSGTLEWDLPSEKGTWIPSAYVGTGTAPGVSNAAGSYAVVGDIVTASFYMTITSFSTANVPMTIAGLPFASSTNNGYKAGVSLFENNNGQPLIQQLPTTGFIAGSYITLKGPISTSNPVLVDKSWHAQAAFPSNYNLAGTVTYVKA